MKRRAATIAIGILLASAAWAAPPLEVEDPMRGPTPIAEETDPPLISPIENKDIKRCLLYTSPSPRDVEESRMPSSA